MAIIRQSGMVLLAVFLIGALVAPPVAADTNEPELEITATDIETAPGETETLEVTIENTDDQAPAEQLNVSVDVDSDNLDLNRTNTTISVDANATETVPFKITVDNDAEPFNYSISAEARRGEKTEANTTAAITVDEPAEDINTSNSEASDESDEGTDDEECITALDWTPRNDLGLGEWDALISCDGLWPFDWP